MMTAFLRRLAFALALLTAVPAFAQTSPFYVVQTGDTLFRIARTHDLSVAELRRLNGLDSDVIRVGQRLVVRPLDGATPRPPQGPDLADSNDEPDAPSEPVEAEPVEELYVDVPADVGQTDDEMEGLTPPDPIPAGPPPPTPPPATITRVAIGGTSSGQIVGGGVSEEADSAQVHVVQPGETLFTIARQYGTTVAALRALNGLDSDLIAIGQQLAVGGGTRPAAEVPRAGRPYDVQRSTLPDDQVHVVRRGETLFSIAVRYGTSVGQLLALNELTSAPLEPGTLIALPETATQYYREPAPLPESEEEGLALVYPDSYVGRETISGEPYDPAALTASHRTLPFGTILHVTMPSTGRSTLVRVNDRGPVSEGFLVELSEAAAEALGQDRGAAEEVELRVVR